MNRRKQIRDALKTLIAGQTVAGDQVFTQRATPLWDVPLPAILIYAREESAEPFSQEREDADGMIKISYLRALTVSIEARLALLDDDNIDDELDELASALERLIIADQTLGGVVSSIIYSGAEIDTDFSSEKPVAAVRLNFDVMYSDET